MIAEKAGEPRGNDFPEIDGYTIQREIGRGGMGVVYLATQESPGRDVALKIVAPHSLRAAAQRRRFLVEIEAMAAVTHPALVPLYGSGEDAEGRPWFSMRLAGGGTLAERLESYQGRWKEIAALMVRLGEAVQYLHERGILHRDLKPANVLFDEQNNACVADFGLAKWAETGSGLTQTTEMLGSPAYLAPEAVACGARATTTAGDVYGLGSIFYELLTGRKLYEGASAAVVMNQILQNAPVPPRQHVAKIPRDLEIITLKALARDPARRYASVAAMVADAGLWLEGKAILARPAGQWKRLGIWARRNPAAAALSSLLAASLITGGFLLWRANQRLTASLDDAEARAEFMTRELPVSLAPLGRLDLLDGVFENISQHYQLTSRTDADSLARQADFLTQWAQILRPRGENVVAVERLRLAMEKARQAAAESDPPLAAVRSRVSTGWRLGEALIEGKQHEEAGAVLKETIAYAAAHAGDDLQLRILDAQLALELAYLEYSRWNLPQVKVHAEKALRKWQPLLPILEHPPIPPRHQITLAEVLKNLYLLELTAKNLNETEAAGAWLSQYEAMAQRLISLEPGNADYRSLLVLAHLRMAEAEGLDSAKVLTLLTSAEEEAAALIARDGGNARWLRDAIQCADALAAHAKKAGDAAGFHQWRAVMGRRLDRNYQMPATEIEFLMSRYRAANACGMHFIGDDWPSARHHFEAALETRRLGESVAGPQSGASLDDSVTAVFELIEKFEGPPAAEKWRAEFKQSPGPVPRP